jgi:hypothetical protein
MKHAILIFISALLFTQVAFAETHSIRWSPIKYSKDEGFIILSGISEAQFTVQFIFYTNEPSRTFLGLSLETVKDADDHTISLSINRAKDILSATHNVEGFVLYELPNTTFNSLINEPEFTLYTPNPITVQVNNLKELYELVVVRKIPTNKAGLDRVLNTAICYNGRIYRKAAVENRLKGLSEEESLAELTRKLTNEKPLIAILDNLLAYTNHEMYRIGDSLFGDENARFNLINIVFDQCIAKNDNKIDDTADPEAVANKVISDSFHSLLENSDELNKKQRRVFSDEIATCFMDKLKRQSMEYYNLYVANLNTSRSIMEARNDTVLQASEKGISIDYGSVKLAMNQCVKLTTSKMQ